MLSRTQAALAVGIADTAVAAIPASRRRPSMVAGLRVVMWVSPVCLARERRGRIAPNVAPGHLDSLRAVLPHAASLRAAPIHTKALGEEAEVLPVALGRDEAERSHVPHVV